MLDNEIYLLLVFFIFIICRILTKLLKIPAFEIIITKTIY